MSIVLNLGFRNRKGLSDVVTAVMLILIGLAVVGLLATAVFNFVNPASFSPAFNCIDWKSNQVLTLDDVCYSSEDDEVLVRVKRTLDEGFDVEGFSFILESEGGESFSFGCGSVGCLCEVVGIGSSKNYYLDVSGLDKIARVVLGFEGCGLDSEKIEEC